MSRRITTPKIDPRTASDLLLRLREMVPHYTREWPARDEDDPGVALLKIFSFISEGVISRLNRAPERNFLSFLDMLGIRLLPARPSRVPVRFLVANGTEDEFMVAKGTQVSAPPVEGRPVEMPFETMENLLVIPASLTALVAVDPEKDRIYKPPPGFLELALAATELPTMTVTAFSAKGSKFLQLNPPGQVQEGDFLRSDSLLAEAAPGSECLPLAVQNRRAIDHLVVAGVRGAIVTLTEPLARDYVEGTIVRKVTRFELYEGKNFQEHVLYLAHGKYFNIKTEARIELTVEHAPGSAANLQPLNIAWEFFGINEETKEEGWHPLAVELDGSAGLSRDGRLILVKPPGEIKEAEVNGNTSRWLRARLIEPIPATPPRLVPRVDSISLIVSSQAGGIPADQAFNNDTPLTVNLPFNPFGSEPRIFDRFYIASAEAFSKPGADVTLNIDLDFTDLLAAPAAVFRGGKVNVFAHGAAGRLVEFKINPQTTDLRVVSHQTPNADTRITARSIPAVVKSVRDGRVGVFVKADDNKIHMRFLPREDEIDAAWNVLSNESSKLPGKLLFDPAAVVLPNDQWKVFVVSDTQLFSTTVNPQNPSVINPWAQHPSQFTIASTPFALRIDSETQGEFPSPSVVRVVVVDDEGHTQFSDHEAAGWTDITPKTADDLPDEDFRARLRRDKEKPFNARPHALPYRDAQDRPQMDIFLRNINDELVVFDTFDNPDPEVKQKHRKNLKTPAGILLDSNPFVSKSKSDTQALYHIFVRGSDNRLWEIVITKRTDDSTTAQDPEPVWEVVEDWTPHPQPSEVNLSSEPFVITYQVGQNIKGDSNSVLLTSDKNALLEFRVRGDDIERGKLQAGPLELIVLRDPLDIGTRTFFLQITDGPGKGSGDNVFKIRSLLDEPLEQGVRQVAVLDKALKEFATDQTKYILYEQFEEGAILGAEDKVVLLDKDTKAEVGSFVLVNEQLRQIGKIEETEEEDVVAAILTENWAQEPDKDDPYVLLTRDPIEKRARAGANVRAFLKATSFDPDRDYKDLLIEITGGEGESPFTRKIVNHFNRTNHIVIESEFARTPEKDSSYRITLPGLAENWQIHRDPNQTELRPQLSWEYWNGKGWLALRLEEDGTENFLIPGEVTFKLPGDIAKTEVAGQENYWIRSRIVGGDYGRELFVIEEKELKIKKDPIRPPLINSLSISYQVTEQKSPDFALTFNNLGFLDQTAANTTADKHYTPFVSLPDREKALYFGFDKEFEGGPVRLYFAAKELVVDERNKPKLLWEFAFDNEWKSLVGVDRTNALTKPEIVTWSVPTGFQKRQHFGEALHWVRATLTEGEWNESPLLSGVFVNTVEAMQARTVRNEILGSSTGTENQRFRFQQLPVLEGEEVRVREVLTDEERKQLIAAEGEDAVFQVRDQEGRILETWVRWKEVIEFFAADSGSRYYRLDRASGELAFGDGVRGRIPPAGGDNIRAFAYQAGGGILGNVAAGEINAPVTAVAGVDSVINPVPAGGGSDKATEEEMLEIGPAQVSNRGRAVTPDDFEWLAKEASREVAKARCIPNRNAAGRREVGWISVHVVPDSRDQQPMPSLELRRAVQRFLALRSDLTVVEQEHIFVGPPLYVPVSVEVTVYAKSIDLVGTAEQKVQESLAKFLHPLTGGPANEGWDFGRDLAASDLYSLLEEIEEVDHIGPLRLISGETESDEQVEVSEHALLASGTHSIHMTVANGE